MDQRSLFQAQVKQVLRPVLTSDGFRGAGPTFRRLEGKVAQVVKIQGSISGGQCCVCLGIHLTFLPEIGSVGMCDPKKITEPGCEFRRRLAPEGQSDFWWSYGSSEEEARTAVEDIVRVYREVGAPYFQRFATFPNDFTHVTPAMLSTGQLLPFPPGGTEVGRALTLSRIALHLGRIEEARQFAEFGIARVGPAVGLKAEFRKILSSD